MKIFKKTLAIICLMIFAQLSFAQITGSAHDFSSETWNTSGEICIVCHTPHNGQVIPSAPLWDHETSVATYTLYSSATMNATIGQPAGNSKLCLSCHDGTVAIDNFGGVTTGTNYISGKDSLGIALGNDHPISFTYDALLATADGELWDPTTVTSGLGGTITNDLLFNDKLECASCHDVHSAASLSFLLVKSNAGSALCLTCHNK